MVEKLVPDSKNNLVPPDPELERLAARVIPDRLGVGRWTLRPFAPYSKLELREGIKNPTDEEQRLDGYRIPIAEALGIIRRRPYLLGDGEDYNIWGIAAAIERDRREADLAVQQPRRSFIGRIFGRFGL